MIAPEGHTPRRQTYGSAGYDLYTPETVSIMPGEWRTINTGVRFEGNEFPTGYDGAIVRRWFAMIAPRSGLAARHGLRLKNTVGIIDQDYRDDILVTVTVDEPLELRAGTRFAQMIFMPYLTLPGEITPHTGRNGGHGSTGVE